MIYVGNKRDGDHGYYVGRPSPLGNPFKMQKEEDRATVIAQYEQWLREALMDSSSTQSKEMAFLVELARSQDLRLVCWCSPKACHADVIAKILKEHIDEV